ncbi:DUF397 domain-containing protein [Actinomycetospora endophytica]|uniref:DUF397 domain-containing protein n=1 Tax=Actinomycetospora endophytica TaxID=2291215 RepID=A0ABS8P3D7_9PSEU|nr:DUF397 domain-containing protein [Actinomycetospora endophytica]MCD2192760.1 DUF397 domain-containing protein [Actinomycetospora endophytica]
MNVEVDPPFRRSSFCGGGNCVEVAMLPGGDVDVRDSKNVALAPHRFTAQEWSDFVLGVKAGEFDFR